MPQSYTELFVHLVWTTRHHHPLLTPDLRSHVYRAMEAECARAGAEVVALGGIEDHVHLLVRMPPTVAPSGLVKQVKGVSSHVANLGRGHFATFRWQQGYGAFSVSRNHVPRVRDYVLGQEEHHRANRLILVLEPADAPTGEPIRHGDG